MNPLMQAMLISVIQGLLLISISPLIIGVIRKVKARLQGRVGAPLLQGYRDLLKFIRKDSVVSSVTTWVFHIAPYMVFASAASAAFLLPGFSNLGVQGDIIFVGFILCLGSVFLVLTGLDAGTTFGGMGSSREAMISSLSEPVFLTAIFALAQISHSTQSGVILSMQNLGTTPAALLNPALGLVLLSLFVVTLAENARYPFDNPTTHLELTMVHEAMVLENSGKNLALMELGSWTKLTVMLSLVATLVIPWGVATQFSWAAIGFGIVTWVVKIFALAAIIAVVESTMAKMRLLRIPALLGMAWVVALLGLVTQYFFL